MAALTNKTTWSVTCTPLASVLDSDGKFEINTVPLTAANLAAQQSLMDTLETALEALTLGVVAQRSSAIIKEINTGMPASPALRGAKWKLACHENGGNNRSVVLSIPAALITGELISGTTQADFTTTEWMNFKSAFEALARSIDNQPLILDGAAYESV